MMGVFLFQSFVQGGEPIILLLFTLLKQQLILTAYYMHSRTLGTSELCLFICSSESSHILDN